MAESFKEKAERLGVPKYGQLLKDDYKGGPVVWLLAKHVEKVGKIALEVGFGEEKTTAWLSQRQAQILAEHLRRAIDNDYGPRKRAEEEEPF